MNNEFPLTDSPNPHIGRGKQIVRAHPEIREYFKPHAATGAWILGVVGLQIGVAALVSGLSWAWTLVAAYLVGAWASHALFVLIHDATHNMISGKTVTDRVWGIICNIGQGFPSAMSFRTFHLLHHSHLDEYDYDGDLAYHWEARLVGRSPIRKMLWLVLFSIVEVVRPMRLKKELFNHWLVVNALVIIATDAAIFLAFGAKGLAYVVLSTFFGIGLHPAGARWIAEHYTFKPGQETYSYYGPINKVSFNIGYHNEHHDLVRVPWVHLPKVRAIASEFYEPLYSHPSYLGVLRWFLFDPTVDLYTRITRRRTPFDSERDVMAA